MMHVYLDGSPLNDECRTLGEALDCARREAGTRLIIEAIADGQPVPPEHLHEPPADEEYAKELQLTSADPAALVRMTLYTAADALDQTRPKQLQSAELIQTGETAKAMGVLGEVLGAWEDVRRSVALVQQVQLEGVLEMESCVEDMESAMKALATTLSGIQKALEQHDLTSVADVLEYDLEEHAESWQSRLVAAADAIAN